MSVEVLYDTIEPAILRAANAAWPEPDWLGWHRYTGPTANKFGSIHYSIFPRAVLAALDALAARVAPLIGDSFIDYDFHAAGLHMLPPGGFLSRHLDAECHPLRPWKRTHSIVLFVNDDWAEEYGGRLRIEGKQRLWPDENLCVIFETQNQWHEVEPTSANAPYRKTLALFAWAKAECNGKTSAQFDAPS